LPSDPPRSGGLAASRSASHPCPWDVRGRLLLGGDVLTLPEPVLSRSNRVLTHPRDQARDLQVRVHPVRAAWPNMLRDQLRQPARWARAITGISPARDTRFGSSKDACVLARLCNNRT
jgi:hypothetical protein